MTNHRISNKVTPLVNEYVENHLEPRGFTTSSTMIIDNDEESSTLLLGDVDNDIGTYQFYFDSSRNLIVADYMNRKHVCGVYNDEEEFSKDFDLPITFVEIKDLLQLLTLNSASAYITVDSYFINHWELLARDGWTDRRIKKEFGIVPKCEFDAVSYYRLNEVIQKEQ
ncbi:hypothetical protein [Enterobacter hormaechei]|uniref:hypothetical protein n=1 Tax=Enterobacter hormaechei TaxID=158836 RepID=UPI0021BE5EE6|nr:hypothetical protein [Enterobacter hormaechei]UXI41499.1 hypothetical protein N5929_21785 [Enterobacter hormaechei]